MSETKTRTQRQRKRPNKQELPDASEAETCLICADVIVYNATGPCNHPTCHKCTFRQRALYNKRQCLMCRTENDVVIISDPTDKPFVDLEHEVIDTNEKSTKESTEEPNGPSEKSEEKPKSNKSKSKSSKSHDLSTYGVKFTSTGAEQATLGLLENTCPQCNTTFASFRDLSSHAKNEHNKFYCTVCSKQKSAFVCELRLYTHKQLVKHQREGESDGFKGHPECKFCTGKRFYSEDELNIHIRNHHDRCFICDQYTPKTADYFRDYDNLYLHFKRAHFVCLVPLCVEKRFVVFRDDLDLTSHMLKEHGGVGVDSKIVIGSLGHYSLLSSGFSSRYLELNNDQEDHNSYDVKRRRFEERAKHYLSYDNAQFSRFTQLNSSYRSKRVSARELLAGYRELFANQTDNEVYLLMLEFLEFFPPLNDLHKSLKSVVDELENKHNTEKFPLLGSPDHLSPQNTAALWVRNGSSSKIGANPRNEAFPQLAKPKTSKSTLLPANQPIRYTTVVKKTVAKPVVRRSQQNTVPNYLSNTASSLASSSTSSLSERKFPALEKKPTKKPIPRVNEINLPDPLNWGRVPEPTNPQTAESAFPVLEKKGKKKKQIIFG